MFKLLQWWQVDKVSPLKLFEENRSLSGFNLRRLMYQQNGVDFVKQTVQKVFKLFQDGKIKPLLDSTWALEDVSKITLHYKYPSPIVKPMFLNFKESIKG